MKKSTKSYDEILKSLPEDQRNVVLSAVQKKSSMSRKDFWNKCNENHGVRLTAIFRENNRYIGIVSDKKSGKQAIYAEYNGDAVELPVYNEFFNLVGELIVNNVGATK